MNDNVFPRKLTAQERELLFSILPEYKPGYNSYRKKINELMVIGSGRFGGGNFILGKENTKPDLSFPSSPVFATGTNVYTEATIDIAIHEEVDDEIEYDISVMNKDFIPETLTEIRKWNYSEWNPGNNAPNDNSEVREIIIVENEYLLAIASIRKKIWLHEYKSGVNFLIPLTNFYNELMRVCRITDSDIALNPSSFFDNTGKFNDEQLKLTFYSYNKYLKRFYIKEPEFSVSGTKKKKSYLSIFRKGKN